MITFFPRQDWHPKKFRKVYSNDLLFQPSAEGPQHQGLGLAKATVLGYNSVARRAQANQECSAVYKLNNNKSQALPLVM